MRQQRGGDILAPLLHSLQEDEPAVAVRLNIRKTDGAEAADMAQHCRKVAWAQNGFYIGGGRPRFTFDPAMHQGRYYVQDPSSMVMETIAGRLCGSTPAVYFDTCAAPGGKTTAAANVLPEGSLVVANEYDRRRADALCENLIKWGYPGIVITNSDTSEFVRLGAFADIVAADVPCSGEGMMRKEVAAVEQWSPQLVEQCAALQREIIHNAWHALKPGGYLIYSTCTFNSKENEQNLAYIVEELGGVPVDMHLTDEYPEIAPAIGSPYPAMRFIPGRIDGEGLFVAVVQRPKDDAAAEWKAKSGKGQKKNAKKEEIPAAVMDGGYLIAPNDNRLIRKDDRIFAIPGEHEQLINELERNVNVIYAGVEIAAVKGRDIIPSQALALSSLLDAAKFPCAEVDYATAIQYLSRQSFALSDAPKGFVLLTYGGRPLGFVKNLGNRANNLYPAPWAIRSTHLPDTPPHILPQRHKE